MRLYLDDDMAAPLLARLLRNAGHDTILPVDLGLSGENDAVHLRHATLDARAIVTANQEDFEDLHDLVVDLGGHHSGILIVCKENDSKRDMTNPGIIRAIRNLLAANVPIADHCIILNNWR